MFLKSKSNSEGSKIPQWLKFATLAVVIFMLHFYISPYSSVSSLMDGIKSNNLQTIVSHLSLPSLRESLKQELELKIFKENQNSWLSQQISRSLKIDSQVKIKVEVVNEAIDLVLTAEGINQLISGEGVAFRNLRIGEINNKFPWAKTYRKKVIADFFKGDFILNRDSINQFHITFFKAQKIRFIFYRKNFGWVLSQISL